MAARLTLYPPDQPARHFTLDPTRAQLIGRGADCDLRVVDPRLSRRHAIFSAANGSSWRVSDLGSKNGTALPGRPAGETLLSSGDWISFGGLLGQFTVLDDEQLAAERQRTRTRWDYTIERSRRLDPQSGVDSLLRQLLQTSLELAGAERGFVMLGDEAGTLELRVRHGGPPVSGADPGFEGSRSALKRALAEGAPVVYCDAAEDTLLGSQPSVISGSIRALACLPLKVGEQVTGLVYLDSTLPGKAFTQLDVELLQAFASHAALVIAAALLRDELAELAALMPAGIATEPPPAELLERLKTAQPAAVSVAAAAGEAP